MQVVAAIREQIRSGALKPGDHVPSARKITREWGVSIATATKVLAALRSERLARGVPGVGTVVVAPPAANPRDHLSAMRRTGRIYAPGGHAKILATGLVEAPTHVADALGVEQGSQVVHRKRVTYQDDTALSASVSWFEGALAVDCPLLLVADRIPAGTPGYIQQQTGRTVAAGRDHLTAVSASKDDAEALGLAPGTAVLRGENWYLDQDGKVIEYGEYVTAGDRGWSYDYNVG
ncbi:MAG: GntR family transcriptional regulator [Dermatophilaceae bacterium]